MEYDPDSPAAWDIRVRRGADAIDQMTGTHTWREALAAADETELYNPLWALCQRGYGTCTEAVADYWNLYRSGLAATLDELVAFFADRGWYHGDPSCIEELTRAWARYLALTALPLAA